MKNLTSHSLNGIFALLAGLLMAQQLQAAELPDFTELVEKVSPAVVHITTSSYDEQQDFDPDQVPEMFRRFFDMPENGPQQRFSPERRGGGSGFIIDSSGYIITNHHVVDGVEEIVVRTSDRREFDAELIGADAQSDIALLKIDAGNLPTLELGSADALKLGEWVLAIGSPFGFEQSVTAGIVSAKGRANGAQQYVPFIQTDVPINRGNSGGPLLNMQGEVVGVNSWILSSNGGFIGLSFSIPVEVAADTVAQLRQYGRVSRGLLGVGIEAVDREMARYLEMDRPRGALVNQVQPGSAADQAGVQVGDVIVEFDNQLIESHTELPPLVGSHRPGTESSLVLNRNGSRQTLRVTLQENESVQAMPASLGEEDAVNRNALGLRVEPLSEAMAGREGGSSSGVVIAEVDSEAAWRAGLRPGDVIVRVNRSNIRGVADFNEELQSIDSGATVALLVERNGTPNFIAYTPEGGQG